jgi:hypothetical protein
MPQTITERTVRQMHGLCFRVWYPEILTLPRSRIALETGMHSPWVSRAVSGLGHEVIVAHARNVRLIGESRKKDDRLDSQRDFDP